MTVQSVRTTVPQVGGNLQKFRNQVRVQTQRQTQSVKTQIRRLVSFRV